jgi:hypothetical protein
MAPAELPPDPITAVKPTAKRAAAPVLANVVSLLRMCPLVETDDVDRVFVVTRFVAIR